MPAKDKYTDPKLRDQVKEEIHESDKGGAPGQWSARKAQMMAQEYKKRGGSYNTDKETGQDESQKNLSKWSEEEWQTKDGSGEAKNEDGSRQRYLPKKAWENMDEDEKEETDQKKQDASKKGQQHVGNTQKAKQSRSKANKEEGEDFEERKEQENEQQNTTEKSSGGRKAKSNANQKNKEDAENEGEEDEEEDEVVNDENEEDSEAEFKPEEAMDEDEEENVENDGNAEAEESDEASDKADSGYGSDEKKDGSKQAAGKKRGRPTKDEGEKKQKSQKQSKNQTMGSKHDDPEAPAQQGSGDRLPNKGDRITWKALPGWVHGELQEILTKAKKVDGKDVKASEKDPRFVLKADSGKICVHKPDACYYD